MEKPNNMIAMGTVNIREFFEQWVEWTKPIHKLRPRECVVAARYLEKHYKLSKVVSDKNILDQILFSNETRAEIRNDLGMDSNSLQVIMTSLRKANVIIQEHRNKHARTPMLNPRFIPQVNEETGTFQLLMFWRIAPTPEESPEGVGQESGSQY